jgi:hypothetical protein
VYSVVMTNYLAGGGDGFTIIPTEKIRHLQVYFNMWIFFIEMIRHL